MTPSDILNKQFARGMNGYKPDDVNQFLGEAGEFVRQLLKENTELQAKIEVLADKLEEYRSDEESLRAALIGAQKLGDSVIREAKEKAKSILDTAAKQADDVIGDARRNIELETYALDKKKLEAAKFKSQLLSLYKQHIDLINSLPYDEEKLPAFSGSIHRKEPIVAPPPPLAPLAQAEEGDVHLAYSEVADPVAEDDGKFPKRKSRFGNLRFGEGFDPVRNE